jgi:hypothetical protein
MRVTIELPDELHRRIKARCALRGETMREFFTRALEQEVAEAIAALKKEYGSKARPKGKKRLSGRDAALQELLG